MPDMPAGATHKAREQWLRWSATSADVAEVARTAERLVARNSLHTELRIVLDSPAWNSEYIDADAFVDALEADDLADVTLIEIRAEAAGRRIAVTIDRVSAQPATVPPESKATTQPVVRLNISGPDREWVLEANDAMKREIDRGKPSTWVSSVAFWGGVGLVVLGLTMALAGAVGTRGERTGVELAGYILAASGTTLATLSALGAPIFPRLELRAPGERSRRERLTRWSFRESGWLLRTLITLAIGALVGFFAKWLSG